MTKDRCTLRVETIDGKHIAARIETGYPEVTNFIKFAKSYLDPATGEIDNLVICISLDQQVNQNPETSPRLQRKGFNHASAKPKGRR